MSIRINDEKKKALKIIASIEGKSMGSIVSGLVEDLIDYMSMSGNSFMEWDNDEDAVYDDL